MIIMANVMKQLSNIYLNNAIKNIQKRILYEISRTLYTDAALHLDKYVRSRKIVHQMFTKSNPKLFKMKMAEIVADEKKNLNLANIHITCCIIDKHSKDMYLLNQIIHKISTQYNSIDSNQLPQIGLHIMLTLHYIRGTDLALKMFMNLQYDDIFQLPLTRLVLLDLLFESKKFREVRQVYDKTSNLTNVNDCFIKSASLLIAVSCYKENTLESLEYGLKFYETLPQRNNLNEKMIAALGILAVNQKAPEVALRLMKFHEGINIVHTCIEIMALADLNELDSVRRNLEIIKNTSNPLLHCLSEEIVPKIKNAIERAGLDDKSQISQLLKDMIKNGYVQKSIFDHYLLSPIKKEQVFVYFTEKARKTSGN